MVNIFGTSDCKGDKVRQVHQVMEVSKISFPGFLI